MAELSADLMAQEKAVQMAERRAESMVVMMVAHWAVKMVHRSVVL